MVKIYEPPTEEMIDQEFAKLRADYTALQERCEKLKQMGDDVVKDRMFYKEKCEKAEREIAALRRELEEARERLNPRKKVCLCGSSRFVDIMAVCQWFIERDEGAIGMGLHLLPYWYCKDAIPDHLAEHEGCADKMNELHLRKIDLADEIFVVNFNDYIGDSTRNEIEYAKKTGKPVRWFTHDPIGEKVKQFIKTAVEGK